MEDAMIKIWALVCGVAWLALILLILSRIRKNQKQALVSYFFSTEGVNDFWRVVFTASEKNDRVQVWLVTIFRIVTMSFIVIGLFWVFGN